MDYSNTRDPNKLQFYAVIWILKQLPHLIVKYFSAKFSTFLNSNDRNSYSKFAQLVFVNRRRVIQ